MRYGRTLIAALAFAAALAPGLTRAQPVDLLLVLCVDASGSIDPEEFRFQREGYAEAVAHPRVVRAMTDGTRRAAALAFVEWGTPGGARTIVDWQRIHDTASAEAFAARILAAPRSPQSFNAVGDCIAHAHGLIRASPFPAERGVIDVSGDGPDNRSVIPVPLARDAAVAEGITINALVILKEGSSPAGRGEYIAEAYRRDVIGGPGAFVITARDYPDFAHAIYNKLIREVAEAIRMVVRRNE